MWLVTCIAGSLIPCVRPILLLEVDGGFCADPGGFEPRLTGEMLADVVRRKGATAGSLDGWGWRELKVLPCAPGFDGLAWYSVQC